MPQDGGGSIPFDISVTACIPSVYHHIVILLKQFGIDLLETRFSYSVKYRGQLYAHDFDSEIREQLQPEIERFQRILAHLHRFGWLTRSRSKLLNALNPFNYVSMGTVLNLAGLSGDFRYKVLKPDVRQLPDGYQRLRHACGALLAVPRVLRHRVLPPRCEPGTRERGASTTISPPASGTVST